MLPMHPALADEHIRDLHIAAERAHLIALARGSQTGSWRRATDRAHAARTRFAIWARRGRLGPAHTYCATC